MRHWLIANTRAGNGSRGAEFWSDRLVRAGIETLQVRDLADALWEDELMADDIVLVAGGDGSVNRVARACLARGAILGVLPSGTANDFARNLSLPEDPDVLCAVIAHGSTRRVDVGWLGERLFLNVVHIGLGTLPTTQASSRLKRWLGRFSYAAMLLQLRRLGLMRGFRAEITYAGGRLEERWLSIAIASGAFFGGGQRIPGAAVDDGRLTLIAVRPRAWWQLAWTFVVTRFNGATSAGDHCVQQCQPDACRIRLGRKRQVTADGELLGRFSELQLRVDAGALRVITGSD
ncbi:diacylglycerol/lipid kinase family protein [Halomonas sp. HK25]|uniref:diacylglycerol/lipid kinase family protein n=1 Tax=Halomonas sp. HK25 TaxID=3394321 RepID=UPI0039FD17E9